MKLVNEEWALDWYNSRGGRVVIKPCFGERVSVHHYLEKDAPKEKIIKRKKSLYQTLQSKGYIRTYIETSKGITILNRVVVFRECANIFQGVKSVYYEDNKGIFSKQFNS
jgi:hypothetical protein